MMPAVLGVLALVLLVAMWLLAKSKRRYGPLFQDSHFLELASVVGTLKEGALAARGRPMESIDDPRVFVTSAGLLVAYTAEELPDATALLCHISLSHRTGYLPWAAGGRFVYQMLRQLGIPVGDAAFAHSEAGVVHVAFLTVGGERAEFERAKVEPLTAGSVTQLTDQGGEFVRQAMGSGELVRTEEELLPLLLSRHPDVDFR